MPISLRIGPLTTAMDAIALELLLRAVTPVAARARITGKYAGRAPAMTAFTATFSTVYSQYSRKCVERMRPTTSSGLRCVAGQHGGHTLFGRQHDRQPVGPAIVEEELLERVRGVRRHQARRRPIELDRAEVGVGERRREALRRLPA